MRAKTLPFAKMEAAMHEFFISCRRVSLAAVGAINSNYGLIAAVFVMSFDSPGVVSAFNRVTGLKLTAIRRLLQQTDTSVNREKPPL